MPLEDTHYLAKRAFAYGVSGLAIGSAASVTAVTALIAESAFCSHRPRRDRKGFRVVALGELLSAVAQTVMGVCYVLVTYFSSNLELISEIFNAIYVVGIIFTTATILQTSYQRWLDLHQLRVGGIRPLDPRHWVLVIVLTILAAIGITCNKLVYLSLLKDSPNTTNNVTKDDHHNDKQINLHIHTATLVFMGALWLMVFVASTVYNVRVLRIAHTRQITRETTIKGGPDTPNRSLASSMRKLIWLRLTLFVYNVSSIFFVMKVVDSIVLTELNEWYSRHSLLLNTVSITIHILQTTTMLMFPLVWLFFCTHFYYDLSRSLTTNRDNAPTLVEISCN